MSAAKSALFVLLEPEKVVGFKKAWFELLAGESRNLRTIADKHTDLESAMACITVRELFSSANTSSKLIVS